VENLSFGEIYSDNDDKYKDLVKINKLHVSFSKGCHMAGSALNVEMKEEIYKMFGLFLTVFN
jgi:hypothetical protein